MSEPIPVKVLFQDDYYDATITRNWGDGVYEIEYENKDWGRDTVDEKRIKWLQEVDIWYEGIYYPARIKEDLLNGTYHVIYHDPTFGVEIVSTDRILWTKITPDFAGHEQYTGAPSSTQESTNAGATSTSTIQTSASVIGQRVQVKYGEDFYTAIIKECHVDEMYLVEYDDHSFGEEVVDASMIIWNVNGIQVDVLFDQKYYRATVRRDLGERGYLVEYVADYGVETVSVDRIRWDKPPVAEAGAAITKQSAEIPTLESETPTSNLIGRTVKVWYEGKMYPAKIKGVPSDGTYLIVYDEPTYGEETVGAPRVVWPPDQPEPAPQQPTPQILQPVPQPASETIAHVPSQVIPHPSQMHHPALQTVPHPTFQTRSHPNNYTSTPTSHIESQESVLNFQRTTQALIAMTKRAQELEEIVGRLKNLPRKYLETISTETQQRVFHDLGDILKEKNTCGICHERPKARVYLPCQHMICGECSFRRVGTQCHFCRTPVEGIVNLMA